MPAGVVVRMSYMHLHNLGGNEWGNTHSSPYELIAAVTRMRGGLSGEEFQEFLRDGAMQRSTLHAYLDLFCYQPPSIRSRLVLLICNCCVALLKDDTTDTLPWRRKRGETVDASARRKTTFGQRTISGQRTYQGLEDEGGGLEVDHPEDLHKYPVRPCPIPQKLL
jgi:hypothetical protein